MRNTSTLGSFLSILLLLILYSSVIGCRGPRLATGEMSPEQKTWVEDLRRWHPGWNAPFISPLRSRQSKPIVGQSRQVATPSPTAIPPRAYDRQPNEETSVDEIIFVPVENEEDQAAPQQHYTVKKGDTLTRIANRFYGDASQWKRIWAANRHVLTSPDKLRPGQVLSIPLAD